MKMQITPYDKEVLYAFRALFEGIASESQQKRAMEWLLLNCCHIGQSSFADTDRDMARLEGERWVGLQIAKLREPAALKAIEGKSRKTSEAKEAEPK